MQGADFFGARLQRAILWMAQLNRTDFSWAEMAGVNLSGAQLSGACLGEALLHGAELRTTILYETDLGGAQLQAAELRGASFKFVDLTEMMGLKAHVDEFFDDASLIFPPSIIPPDRFLIEYESDSAYRTAWRAFQRSIGQDPGNPE